MKNKFIGFILTSAFCSTACPQGFLSGKSLTGTKSGLTAAAGLSTSYNYNVFYDYGSPRNDFSTLIQPSLGYKTSPKTVSLNVLLEGNYEKFSTYTVQDHFAYRSFVEIPVLFESGFEMKLSGEYKAFSDRAATDLEKRLPRATATAQGSVKIPLSSSHRISLVGTIINEDFQSLEHRRFNHMVFEGVGTYERSFLPETSWFIRGTTGLAHYTQPTLSVPDTDYAFTKADSGYVMSEGGISGRLTERATIDAAFGYLYRLYNDTTKAQYTEPVFYIRFIEQVTRRDQLIGGFNYIVRDALWSNYLVDQEIFIGLGRVVGDQMLLLSRLAYNSRTYSGPRRRDDQRVTASFAGRYSLSPQIKLTSELGVDFLNSDQFNTHTISPLSEQFFPDRPASYMAGKFSVGITAAF